MVIFKRETLVFCLIFMFILLLYPISLSSYQSPWEIEKGEKIIEGFLISSSDNLILVKTKSGENSYKLSKDVLVALMGKHSGQLVTPKKFPLNIDIEMFINQAGYIRAFRNKQMTLSQPEGKLLSGWGHNASLSPDELFYVMYNLNTGLHLYSILPNESPLNLSLFPVSAWNSHNEIAYYLQGRISIYNVKDKTRKVHFLPTQQEGIKRVITDMNWNCNGDKLYYAALEDYPDIGSDIFRLAVLDRKGDVLGNTVIPNLGSAIWLKNDLILYIAFNSMETDNGRMFLWNYKTGKTVEFLPGKDNHYQNTAYNPDLEALCYTASTGLGESLYMLNMANGIIKKITSFPYRIRNMQWSGNNTLLFWDELNNCVVEIKDLFLRGEYNQWTASDSFTTIYASGYLPPGGVRYNYLYFLEEPLEEPQQVFLTQNKQADSWN